MADVLDLNAEEFVEEDDGNRNAFLHFFVSVYFHIFDLLPWIILYLLLKYRNVVINCYKLVCIYAFVLQLNDVHTSLIR